MIGLKVMVNMSQSVDANATLLSDEEYARFVQEQLDKEVETFENRGKGLRQGDSRNKETYYKKGNDTGYIRKGGSKIQGYTETNNGDTLLGNNEQKGTMEDVFIIRNLEALELQRQELAKIERWKKLMEEDEKLAKQLNELTDDQDTANDPDKIECQRKDRSEAGINTNINPSFKRVVAQHKASKAKALAQLQQYRDLQRQRFELETTAPLPPRDIHVGPSTSTQTTPWDQQVIAIDDDPFPVFDMERNKDNRPTTAPHIRPIIDQPYTTPSSTAPIRTPAIDLTDQSDEVIEDHVILNSQSAAGSQAVKNSNIKCGNCGEKGHNRTFVRCPRYHTAEETARREAKQEKFRQQREDKKKQEEETINLLTQHQQVLEDMTSQIQEEMSAIQNRLQARATALGAQVNSRMKKIDKNKKKKR